MPNEKATNSTTEIDDAIKEMHRDAASSAFMDAVQERHLGGKAGMGEDHGGNKREHVQKPAELIGLSRGMKSAWFPDSTPASAWEASSVSEPKAAIMEMKAREDSNKSRKSRKKA